MRSVEGTRRVLDSWSSGDGVWIDTSSVPISSDRDEPVSVTELESLHLEVKAGGPVHERQEKSWCHNGCLYFSAVTVAVKILE